MKKINTQFIVRSACICLLAASCAGDLDEKEQSVVSVESVSPERRQNALLIQDEAALDILNRKFDMGMLLGEVGVRENTLAEKGRSAGRWVAHM